MSEYDVNAKAVLRTVGGRIKITQSDTKRPPWDDGRFRHHYRVRLTGPGGSYVFDFWDSVHNAERGLAPTPYDVLAALEWFDPGTFEDFANEFGYDTDSRKAHSTYRAVMRQVRALERIFPDAESRVKLAEIR